MLKSIDTYSVILECARNNRVAQQEFYTKFYGYAATICNKYVSNEEDLIELVNDGFLKIFKAIEKFEVNEVEVEKKVRAWIKSIMIHTCIDFYRRKKTVTIINTDENNWVENVGTNDISPIDKLSYNEIVELINKLPPSYKLIFNLSVIDGLSHQEIAKVLQISEGTSKSNLFKARNSMIKFIQEKNKKNLI